MTDTDHRHTAVSPTAGGGAHDVTGPEAAAHVDVAHSGSSIHAVHGAEHAVVHDDEHEDRAPGPIDWAAWRAALVGVLVAGLICLLLYLAIT